jgi:Repeat of unknown function (DUF5907)
MDWSNPVLTSTYTDHQTDLKNRDLDLAKGCDPAIVTVTNPPTNMIRWNSASNRWEKYNGTTWDALSATYAITVATANAVANDSVGNAGLRNSVGVSVIGRSANSTGDPADIAAGSNDLLLRRTGDTLNWGQLTVGMLPDAVVTFAKFQNVASKSLVGNNAGSAGVSADIGMGQGMTMSSSKIHAGSGSLQTLTDGATINWDCNSGADAQVTLGGNRTMAAPTNMIDGMEYTIYVIQDGTGSRTLAWNSIFKFPLGIDPVLSTAAGSIDLLIFKARSGNLYGSMLKGMA